MSTLTSIVVLYVITLAHHLYGGIVFASTERLVISVIFTVALAATLWLHRLGAGNRWARRAYWGFVAAWVTLVGLFEGGYNHALYVALRLGGAGPETMRRVYPDGIEVAASGDDLFFQGTGVLTLLAVIPVLLSVVRGRAAARSDRVSVAR